MIYLDLYNATNFCYFFSFVLSSSCYYVIVHFTHHLHSKLHIIHFIFFPVFSSFFCCLFVCLLMFFLFIFRYFSVCYFYYVCPRLPLPAIYSNHLKQWYHPYTVHQCTLIYAPKSKFFLRRKTSDIVDESTWMEFFSFARFFFISKKKWQILFHTKKSLRFIWK